MVKFTLKGISNLTESPAYFQQVNGIYRKDGALADYTHHVYDVVLLINGIPVVQIELKNQQISPSRAMEQIIEYKSDIGNGYTRTLMCFLQIFIVSNQHDTWYFANNNQRHFSFDAEKRFLSLYQFADKDNKKITHLETFTEKFLAKCTLGQMISRYMVLVDSEQKLMIMRPYQIYAVKAIMDCVHTNCGNGYIWHTTGSGKTLTSFKTSTLLKENPEIEKCLFVVDRKDLDKQTVEEFNRFQEGCVTRNTHTEDLVSRLLSNDYSNKVIVTTIQKLGLALSGSNKKNYKKQLEPLRHKRMVLIFDECHRSQFGDNQAAIKEFFSNAQLFGFTGTPIFEQNASTYKIEGEKKTLKTTKDVFERLLHAYTITHAIEDRNVLRFHLDYYKPKGKNPPQPGQAITKKAIINSIFEKHDAATASRKFNAILVTAGIDDAIEYFELFKNLQEARLTTHPEFKPLNIACVFTPPAEGNKDVRQMQEDLDQERRDNTVEPEKKKQALIQIIEDYNAKYGTNHKITEFTQYYSDVQSRVKSQEFPNRDLPHNQKIDILIVVEMLLTGFNAPFLNTLYVDRNLTYHRLIQAFSRTNRVINDTKPYGNILDFRQQQDAVSDAIALFSGESSPEVVKKIWLVDPAETVIETLDDSVKKLAEFMESQGLENKPSDVPNLKGEAARSQFINLFKEVQRAKTQLDQYTDLNEKQKQTINTLLPKDQLQGFRGAYLEVAERLRSDHGKKGKDASSEVEDLDFEFVLFASELIDYDYIMKLLARYSKGTRSKQKLTRNELIGLIRSDSKFMNDVDDIEAYINTLKVGEGLTELRTTQNCYLPT